MRLRQWDEPIQALTPNRTYHPFTDRIGLWAARRRLQHPEPQSADRLVQVAREDATETVLNDRTNAHFLDIASTLTPANGALRGFMSDSTSQLASRLGSMHAAHAAALRQLWDLAYREASTMAYADAFRAVGIICLIATCLVPLLRKVTRAPAPSADAH